MVVPRKAEVSESEEVEFLGSLSHELRKRILETIHDRVELSYTELLDSMGIGEGTLNFHLRRLSKLIERTPKGTYILSPKGRLAIDLIQAIKSSLGSKPEDRQYPRLSSDIVLRRIAAFLIDALIFFVFTGVFLEPLLWRRLLESLLHFGSIIELHPWVFHEAHLPMIRDLALTVVGVYSHVFFAIYIMITVLEAYKGQTPGKYVMGIRVVKVGGGRIGLLESSIRNAGKVFLLPLDLLVGLIAYSKRGYLRFFDHYTDVMVERTILQPIKV